MSGNSSMDEKFKRLDDALDRHKKEAETVKPKIGRVTFMLREHENFKKHFMPRAVAVGPIHHGGDSKYEPAEEIKRRLAAQFIENSGQPKEDLYQLIRDQMEELKGCYAADVIKINDDDLAWILFVDGCALLHFIQYTCSASKAKELRIKMDLVAVAMQDLFLLENQLPYRLLELLMDNHKNKSKLMESIQQFITLNMLATSAGRDKKSEDSNPVHLLDMLRRAYLGKEYNGQKQRENQSTSDQREPNPPHQQKNESFAINICPCLGNKQQRKGNQNEPNTKSDNPKPKIQKRSRGGVPGLSRVGVPWCVSWSWTGKKAQGNQQPTFRNIVELKAAGIRVSSNNTGGLTDIDFKRGPLTGTLLLHPIRVDDSTAPIFLNLAAYEMCPDFQNDFAIASYICFMDSLIDHPEDVKELRNANVLHNLLGSDDEVAKLFNEISTDLVPHPEKYQRVKKEIQSHFENKIATWMDQFIHDHFSSPWTFLAFIGVITGLVLSLMQTIYSKK